MDYKKINTRQAYEMMELDNCDLKMSVMVEGFSNCWTGIWLTRVTDTVLQG